MSDEITRALLMRSREGADPGSAVVLERATAIAERRRVRRHRRVVLISVAATLMIAASVGAVVIDRSSSDRHVIVGTPTSTPGANTTTRPPVVAPTAQPILFTRGGALWIDDTSEIPVGTGPGLRALTAPCACGAPVWSPDHHQIAFLQGGALSVMDADGSNVRSLGQRSIFRPAWSPDGTRLAFSAGSGNGGPIEVVNVDGSDLRTVADVFAGAPSWSPDGNTILYTDLQEPLHISKVDVATGTVNAAVSGPGIDGEQAWPAYSPDGRSVALTNGGGTQPTGIFVAQVDGTKLRRLTTGNDTEPAWSPDGTQIVFARAAGNTQRLLVVTVATGAVQPLLAQDTRFKSSSVVI